jgi:hypothetical protein
MEQLVADLVKMIGAKLLGASTESGKENSKEVPHDGKQDYLSDSMESLDQLVHR